MHGVALSQDVRFYTIDPMTHIKQKANPWIGLLLDSVGTPGAIRTPYPLVRS
jgi:hypothetical protein